MTEDEGAALIRKTCGLKSGETLSDYMAERSVVKQASNQMSISVISALPF
jgi:hypothetical protein